MHAYAKELASKAAISVSTFEGDNKKNATEHNMCSLVNAFINVNSYFIKTVMANILIYKYKIQVK
jgi:hypothetical protein